MATLAGVGISLGIVLYLISDKSVPRKIVHLVALLLIVTLSALFGRSTTGIRIVQRLLYAAGFAWLIFIEMQPTVKETNS